MASTVSVFISGPVKLSNVVEIVSKSCSCEFVDRTESVGHTLFESELNGVWLSVFDEHGLEDDCGIPFSEYSVEVDLTTSCDLSAAKLMANRIGRSIQSETKACVMIVENLQKLIPLEAAGQ